MLEIINLTKSYSSPGGTLEILNGVTLQFQRGDAAAVMGPSGCGKSTLLYVLGGLDAPNAGTVTLDGLNPFTLSEREMAKFRNRKVGFVFQDHCLLPQCTVLENVLTPTLVSEERADYVARARGLLEKVGLSTRLDHLPSELSGGEKQRAAIARALICDPVLLLCDEPTGNLDRASAEQVAQLLLELHREKKTILILVTHSAELAARFPRQFQLVDRRLEEQAPCAS